MLGIFKMIISHYFGNLKNDRFRDNYWVGIAKSDKITCSNAMIMWYIGISTLFFNSSMTDVFYVIFI